MKRRIHRSYFFADSEVNEAIVAYLRAKDLPCPEYVGNAGTTKWSKSDKGLTVEWVEEGEVDA